MKKQYPGHAKRVMFGVWSFLRQFMYTKFIIVTDDDVDVRDWKEVVWAITTRVDPARDTLIVENTPIDYLDFASPVAGLGAKMGIDATNKWPRRNGARMGPPDRHGRCGEAADRCAVAGARTGIAYSATARRASRRSAAPAAASHRESSRHSALRPPAADLR